MLTPPESFLLRICASFAARHDIIRPSPRSHAAEDSAAVAEGRVSGTGTSMVATSRPNLGGVPRGSRKTSPFKIRFQSLAILCGGGTPARRTMRVTPTDQTSALAPYSLPETTSGAE